MATQTNIATKLAQWMAISSVAVALVGCGGGDSSSSGSGSSSGSSPSSSQQVTTPTAPAQTNDPAPTTSPAPAPAPTPSVNNAPVISGTPALTLTAGTAYSFTPSATDADGDSLSFSIQNKPSWATFSISTGKLSGTPTGANVGNYAGIVISVSDGNTTTALATFAINVTPVTTGRATVTWTPPTQNTDGSTLTGLTGYTILYGNSPSALTQTVQITNISVTTYTIDNLTTGTWYFAVKAVSSSIESASSAVGSKTI